MQWKIVIISFAWLALLCFWIAGIFLYKPHEPRNRDKRWTVFLTSVILVTITVGLFMAKYFLKIFDFPTSFGFTANILGLALILSGLFFAIWARITLGCFWSGSVAFIEGQPIVSGGPYAFVRHPIYTGMIMMLWGSFLLERIGFILFIAVLGTAFLLLKARLEEAMLTRRKEEEYIDYKKKVSWTVI